jgi:hypothetical protein
LAFLPFIVLMIYYLLKNRPYDAHTYGGYSLMVLTIWLVIVPLFRVGYG